MILYEFSTTGPRSDVSNPRPVVDFDAALTLIGPRSSVVCSVGASVGHVLEIMWRLIG